MLKRNDKLETIRTNWAGNRVVGGKYVNQVRKSSPFKPIGQWRVPLLKERSVINYGADWKAQVIEFNSTLDMPNDSIVWLGHSSFIINLGGVRIAIDPVFWSIPFVRRQSDMPIDPSKIDHIDILLLSHDHFDHTDRPSIKELAKNNSSMQVAAGLGLKTLIHGWTPHLKVHEMGWYQQTTIKGVNITFLPALHWGKRSASDGAKRLWGAFLIEYNGKKIYFSGDTAFSSHFAEVYDLFGEVDYAILGIGAYRPRWFLERNHISPSEAVEAAQIMKAKVAIPMHYGTFKLSREPLFDPPLVFKAEAMRKGVENLIPLIGEIVELP